MRRDLVPPGKPTGPSNAPCTGDQRVFPSSAVCGLASDALRGPAKALQMIRTLLMNMSLMHCIHPHE